SARDPVALHADPDGNRERPEPDHRLPDADGPDGEPVTQDRRRDHARRPGVWRGCRTGRTRHRGAPAAAGLSMGYVSRYSADAPDRVTVDAMTGPVVLEFGTDWCGDCQAAQPGIKAAMADYPDLRHVKVEDGRGRRLGRSFGVKLWPTLVFLRD